MDAIVTAGGIPQPDDPLYLYSHGDSKALIDVAGKPMIQWVLDALGDAKNVDSVIVVGLSAKSGVICKKPMHFVSNQGRMLANVVAGVNKALELDKKTKYVLIVSSDIPALKPEMVDWLIETSMQTKDDLYYGVCSREVMEARFPESKRTYTKLKDIELCGADINISHVRMATEHLDTWEALMGSRKTPWRQAGIVGFRTLFAFLMRSDTLDDMVVRISKRLGINGRAIVWPNAEACMDVDKPHQLEILREDLARQERKALAKEKRNARKAATQKTRKPIVKKTATLKKKPTKKTVTSKKTTTAKPAATKTKSKAKPKKK